MANSIEYENNDIKYTNLLKPQVVTGLPLSRELYKVQDGKLTEYPDPLINAIDINWGGATVKDTPINTTDDLLSLLNTGDFGGEDTPDIDSSKIIGIMLSAIRSLQSEVSKLRNSFRFGINSYTGEEFGMSETVSNLSETNEEEPLWATDESELSFIEGLDLSQQAYQYIVPVENYELIPNNRISYRDTISFIVPKNENNVSILEVLEDPKQYAYITCSSKNVDILLHSENKDFTIHVSDLIKYNYAPEKYNILVIVSKKVLHKENSENDGELVGENFIWISVSEWGTGTDLFNGYISDSGVIDELTSETPIYNDDIYNISEIIFNTDSEDYIYKLDIYSKYQDFTKTIEAATPVDVEDYKYRTAAITIRSMSTEEKIQEHINELQNNELVFCEFTKKLYIYTNGNLINIGSGGSNEPTPEEIMENYQILKALEEQGLINIEFIDIDKEPESLKYDEGNIKQWILNNKVSIKETLNNIEKINFINGDTGKLFDVTMNPYGEFDIKEKHTSVIMEKNGTELVPRTISSMQEYLTKPDGTSYIDDLPDDYHSDRGFVSLLKGIKKDLNFTGDMRLDADRIEIGSVYAPLDTDKIHGCTHGFIELFNSSDEDFYLDGSYLHYSYTNDISVNNKEDVTYYKLALDGYIPAGGTYLIRCKKYAEENDPNVFINVKTYDKEWYIAENELLDLSINKNGGLSLALTYDDKLRNGTPIDPATIFTMPVPSSTTGTYILSGGDTPLLCITTLIDSICIGNDWSDSKDHWVPANGNTYKARAFKIASNTIYKVTFELDPAKQAFNSMTTKDSSRRRWANAANDQQTVSLTREFIEFPKTDIKKKISDYTPKASFEHKNVITDKTKLNKEKPNALVCSYGINPYTTRCFNWVSSGLFEEALVIIDQENKEHIFKSYTEISTPIIQSTDEIHRKEFPVDVNNIVYAVIYNKFPGNNEPYASHKCIIEFNDNNIVEPQTYNYYVCRLDSYGKIDNSYKSDVQSFTLYPKTYKPKVYQITDQQGFHWIEYQVWAAAAKKVNEKILADCEQDNIMPIIINTGDCVQSGARVNEWLDYFEAGKYLFNHFEQNNIVGNNDLCDTDKNALGTGDDTGKSNGYFFHLFNCVEIPTDKYKPIINGEYVPSLYYIDILNGNKPIRILFINSEITVINCRDWFKLKDDNNNAINIYTGFNVNSTNLASFEQQYLAKKKYTIEQANTYNENLEGAIKPNTELTEEQITLVNTALGKTYSQENNVISPTDAIEYNRTLPGKVTENDYCQAFYPIYEILWQWTADYGIHWTEEEINNAEEGDPAYGKTTNDFKIKRTFLPVCHEMPFTVITNACLSWTNANKQYSRFRSLSDAKNGKLIGSHTNQINDNEFGKGMHWMSRLFEYRGITLCLGGHKHTYACTYPVRENYLYTQNDENKWSYLDGAMDMPQSLENDSAIWTITVNVDKDTINGEETTYDFYEERTINLSKFPIVNRPDKHKNLDGNVEEYSFEYNNVRFIIKVSLEEDAKKRFYPYIDERNQQNNNVFVIYDMSQATGYKLTSNKELPSEYQKFSMIIPKTSTKISNGKFSDTASKDQQMPMFSIIDLLGDNKYNVQVARIINISNELGKMTFKQNTISKKDSVIEYLGMATGNANTYMYGFWCRYDNKKLAFVQTDAATTKIQLNYINSSELTFNPNDNINNILYPDIITPENIYLFKI